MFEAFLVTLRESAELMLIVAALRAYLHHAGRPALDRHVIRGTALGIALGAALATIMIEAPVDPRLQALVTIAFALSVLVVACGMFSSARVIRGHVQDTLEWWLESASAPLAVMGLSALLALRETLEVALFIYPAGIGADAWPAVLGILLGLSMAAALGLAYRSIKAHIDLLLAFRLSALILSLLAIQLLLAGIGELLNAQAAVTHDDTLAHAIAPFVAGGEWYLWVCASLMVPPVLALARGWWREAGAARR